MSVSGFSKNTFGKKDEIKLLGVLGSPIFVTLCLYFVRHTVSAYLGDLERSLHSQLGQKF